jgi:molybdate transport system substrate-binding protein
LTLLHPATKRPESAANKTSIRVFFFMQTSSWSFSNRPHNSYQKQLPGDNDNLSQSSKPSQYGILTPSSLQTHRFSANLTPRMPFKPRHPVLRLLFAAALFWQVARASAATVLVFAAASLTDSLHEIASDYEKTTTDHIVFNLGGSSTLARQIEEGAPADIFFSADEGKMNILEAKGLIVKWTRKSRLSNSLVIVVAAQGGAEVHSPQDLAIPRIKRIALGDPKAVPIGVYAREYLQSLKLWDSVQPKVVATDNVRAALAAVEAGDADASIVYATDAAISKKVKVAFAVPADAGPKISYPVALLHDSPQPSVAAKFLDYLNSDPAAKVFRKFGFIVRD